MPIFVSFPRPWKEATGTGVSVTCACWGDADSPILKKEQLYWELRNHTCNMTKLGSYMLDERSLFLDGEYSFALSKSLFNAFSFSHSFIHSSSHASVYPFIHLPMASSPGLQMNLCNFVPYFKGLVHVFQFTLSHFRGSDFFLFLCQVLGKL